MPYTTEKFAKSSALARKKTGLLLGPVFFAILLALPTPEGMSATGMSVAAVVALMATYWITEAIPIAATALIPIALFPILGVMPADQVTLSYANHLIYLFMGGFLIAVAIEKWQLHKRIALHTINIIGVTPKRIIFGFMLVTAFLSSWISNTAAAMMMVTIGLAVLKQVQVQQTNDLPATKKISFGTSLMLGIAYSASIGGVATLIGTPPNAILAGVLEKNYNITISFADWMLFALPLSILMLLICWFYLTHFVLRDSATPLSNGTESIKQQLHELGPMKSQERKVLLVFVTVVAAWLFRGLFEIDALTTIKDSTIAIAGALLLFIIPADLKKGEFLLDWKTAKTIPWDIIILFGGGFALANGFVSSELTEWLANNLYGLKGVNTFLLLLIVVSLVIFLTEITSNTATASLFIPIVGAFALAAEMQPQSLMTAVALSASFAFMLPVATPPNAIVFSSRQVTIPQMAKAGLWLNLISALIITLFISFFM